MSVCAAQASSFFKEVAKRLEVWTIRDEGGFPCPMTSDGKRAMPFWSLESRAKKVVANVPAYEGFEVVSVLLEEWHQKWLPDLAEDGLLVGINWSGKRAAGYDYEPEKVEAWLQATCIENR